MDYLGGLRGTGRLVYGNAAVARTQYDFDGYLSNGGQVTSCGEIRLPASVLRELFGRADLKLQTADGRWLRLRFSEKRLPSSCNGAAHVDVAGDLPAAAEWRRRSAWNAPQPTGPDRPSIPPLHARGARG
ncbi:hypothetical protein MWN33_11565 [Starkeya koreensis]|uniref:Uncharacterized protein n=1 Tax=Ancylobacter koreensis TaxID=266121 RepID=A0ABT0DN05_9HYPH|nr:hypothetical protein [Ancylobacter koreensis]MCK0208664.1 hypothetical protein [Ancylobacter koreensis]